MNTVRLLEILRDLIAYKSITPSDAGAINYIENLLTGFGFTCKVENIDGVNCIYAKYGSNGKNFCFSGHIDVVPPGPLFNWRTDPFEMKEIAGYLYGRGMCDMKGAIAAFICAAEAFISGNQQLQNTLSILITSDEEKAGVTSCDAFLESLHNQGEEIDYCLLGEPTSIGQFGDAIMIGRRGSVTFELKVTGVGGHVAYQGLFQNPITPLTNCLKVIQAQHWDDGNEDFEKSNLEVVGVTSDSQMVANMVPHTAAALMNIRFNNEHVAEEIIKKIEEICTSYIKSPFQYSLNIKSGNKPFVSTSRLLANTVRSSIKSVMGIEANYSTSGGTTDGAYISKYCKDTADFGMLDSTAHKANENISTADLNNLASIYLDVIQRIVA